MNLEIQEQRIISTDGYDERTGKQQKWYSSKATIYKKIFQNIGLSIVVLGALVSVIPIFGSGSEPATMTEIITSVFGGLIVILKGVERIWLPEEHWTNYRKASESLKREKEMYIEGIEPYISNDNEEELYRLYVERCIRIKAEEQNNFWGLRENKIKK